MRSAPHPNQVRASCDRCRRQKLRCTRESPADVSCTRCTRLGQTCVTGTQRRVGRPSKSNEVVRVRSMRPEPSSSASSSPTDEEVLVAGLNQASIDVHFTDWVGGSTADWATGIGLPPLFEFDIADIPTAAPAPPLPLYTELPLPNDHYLTYPSLDAEFRLLSTVNMDLHRLGNMIAYYTGEKDFESFMSYENENFSGYAVFQSIMTGAQQYVLSIRTLRQKLRIGGGPLRYPSTSGDMLLTTGYDESDTDSQSSTEEVLHTLDSSTALLVVSCFTQLVKFEEFVFQLFLTSAQKPVKDIFGYREVHLAGVQIIDSPLQGVLFTELVLHMLNQAMAILGIPTKWAKKGQGPGLCSPPRYREMLNKELGDVKGLWSSRPAKLVELATQMKHSMSEICMSEIYTC